MSKVTLPKANIGLFTLSMLNVAAVLSIVNFPEQAQFGYTIVFYITAGAVCFFIPSALVSAELASTFPQNGGLYLWAKNAFGPGLGFLTVSMQWLNSLPWFATVLTFIATTIAYMFDPELATNRWFVYLMIVGIMWGCTIVNCRGIKLYALLSSQGAIIGTVIPTLILIAAAVIYLGKGNSPAIAFDAGKSLLPEMDSLKHWMLLAGMMVSLAGIDMTAVHVTDVAKPERTFPRAILISSIIIILGCILGSLSIALVVNPAQLSMASGTGEAFEKMFNALGVHWMTPVICVLLIIGALTTIITWILGPSKGLLEVAEEGYLPPFWSHRNRHDIPSHILIIQATITSLLALVVFFMPTIGGAFWVMMALSAQLYMVMYLFMFASALRLRWKYPDISRPYKIPGGKGGMIFVCGLGILTALLAMAAGTIPPESIRVQGLHKCIVYSSLLTGGVLLFMAIPVLVVHHEIKRHRNGGR